MINEILDTFKKAAGFDDKRPILLDTTRGEYIYHDDARQYKPLLPEFKRGVSTVESLAVAVLEEARRRENATGNFMTVLFNERGGVFYVDDKARLDQWTYERCLSQQWTTLKQHLGRDMKHLEFVRFLQTMRSSIQDYTVISREFKKVTFDGNNSVTSQPIIEDGQAGTQVSFTLNTKNGDTQNYLPGEIKLQMPFTRGGTKLYDLTIELDVALKDNKVLFCPVVPDIESITEQAISDEVNYFEEQVKSLTELLVLLDY
jgi:hypothetical protein